MAIIATGVGGLPDWPATIAIKRWYVIDCNRWTWFFLWQLGSRLLTCDFDCIVVRLGAWHRHTVSDDDGGAAGAIDFVA